MSNLQQRQEKIQTKRKQTPFREFVMEICSWRSMSFYKTEIGVSRYPNTDKRKLNLITIKNYFQEYPTGLDTNNTKKDNSEDSFFHIFKNMFYTLNHIALEHHGINNENSERADGIWGVKNVYLSVSAGDTAENVLYSFKTESNVKNIISSINITQGCYNIFESRTIKNSDNIFYSNYIYSSSNIWFSSNLIGCEFCFGCNNLNNKSYCINNKQFTKSDYIIELKKLLNLKHKYTNYSSEYHVQGAIQLSNNVTGYAIFQSNNISEGYDIAHIQNGRNVIYSDGGNDSGECYDSMDVATNNTYHLYGVYGQVEGNHIYCSAFIGWSSHIYYSYFLDNCSFCMGCIGLKNKSYCILNKQYSKEERYEKVDEIFRQMEEEGTLGEFFPASMNPFYFNDTAAYLIDPSFTKEEVVAKGYLWRDEPIKVDIPEGAEVVKTNELGNYEGFDSNGNRIIDKEILNKIIQDEEGNVYRIVKMEYEFLVKHGLPLPRKHWLERMKENFRIK